MDKQANYSGSGNPQGQGRSFPAANIDYPPPPAPPRSLSYHHEEADGKMSVVEEGNNSNSWSAGAVVDRTLSFADVMQFADFGSSLPSSKVALMNNEAISKDQQDNDDGDQYSTGGGGGIIDPVYLLKFPVLNNQLIMQGGQGGRNYHSNDNCHNLGGDIIMGARALEEESRGREFSSSYDHHHQATPPGRPLSLSTAAAAANHITSSGNHHYNNPVQLEFLTTKATDNDNNNNNTDHHDTNIMDVSSGGEKITGQGNNPEGGGGGGKGSSSNSKRKRPRTIKTSEEVESQRMTHIAVERNRRKQMNEHLRVLRSLMPTSYVQRGDQASIIGGAIEFVRELEQLLQCLESQKRRRLYGDQAGAVRVGDPASASASASSSALALAHQQSPQPPLGFPVEPLLNYHHQDEEEEEEDHLSRLVEWDPNNNNNNNNNNNCSSSSCSTLLLREESAESKSCIADVEVKVLGFDALIKILSRRRPGQLIKAIAALEDLHFTILHTNITTIEHTVLYSFNVKVATDTRFTAEDIATSVQQIFTFIHANTNTL